MLYLILGNNTYLAEQEVVKLERSLGVARESIDPATLTLNGLADIMRGNSLFSQKRLIVIRGLAEQKLLWDKLAEWASDMAQETTLVLVEAKLDRRTKSYKTLTKSATLIRADRWRERDSRLAEEWVRVQAKKYNLKLSPSQVHDIVMRARVPAEGENYSEFDQFILHYALSALSSCEVVTDDAIATVLPATTTDRVFDLLAIAVSGKTERILRATDELRLGEEPHRVFALIATQWSQLVALALGDGAAETLATELAIHPYVAQKLRELTQEFSATELRTVTSRIAEIDVGMKLSQFDPWDGVERALLAIALR